VLERSERSASELNWKLEWLIPARNHTRPGTTPRSAVVRLVGTKRGGRWASDFLPTEPPEVALFQQAQAAATRLEENSGARVTWKWLDGRPLLLRHGTLGPTTFEGFEVKTIGGR
jgi:hypothetical protein